MSDLAIFFLFGLATWRISNILVHEDGPFRVFDFVRWASNQIGWGEGDEARTLGQLFACVWCMSVWVAFVLVMIWEGRPTDPAIVVVLVFALSTVAVSLSSIGKVWSYLSNWVRYRSLR